MASQFSVWDYVIFAAMLLICSVIGIYYGYKGKQNSTKEYLTAGQSIHWIPICVSLLVSFISAISLMGMPSEVYTYGVQYLVVVFSFVFVMAISSTIYAPLFYELRLTSANEYLERRFNRGVRLLGTVLFILQYTMYLSVVLYAPSLALEAVAGVPLAASIVSTGAVCTFYTTLGGMRAVIWTDVFQSVVMVLGLIVMISIGATEVGGLGEVISIIKKGQRSTLFDFNPDPTVRNTFWAIVIGSAFSFLPYWTISQVCVQRFLSARCLKDVRRALYVNIIGLFLFISLCVLAGLVMYAVYADCDPRTAKKIISNDQIVAYFIVHKLGHLTGVPGLFTACLFSGALSTASSGLNSLSAVVLEDIVKKIAPQTGDRQATLVSKVIAGIFGLIIIGGAFLVSVVGTMVLQISCRKFFVEKLLCKSPAWKIKWPHHDHPGLPDNIELPLLAYTISGIVAAPYFGLFTLGILVRRATWKGAYIGVLCGLGLNFWISIGSILYPPDKRPAPISTKGCDFFNATARNSSGIVPYNYKGYDFPLAKLYSLSYLWYGALGIFVTFGMGCIFSLLLGKVDNKIDDRLIFDFKDTWRSFWYPLSYEVEHKQTDLEMRNKSSPKNSKEAGKDNTAFE